MNNRTLTKDERLFNSFLRRDTWTDVAEITILKGLFRR